MRDYLVFYVNGKEHRVAGAQAFQPLSSYLRYDKGATGTKVVCEEGDCGACSVIVGRMHSDEIVYRPVNSCIQFLYQLDCTHVITIEGLKYDGQLNPVQDAMVSCHGAQCGYCTPGFVVTMCAMFDQAPPAEAQEIKDGLTGNLCRCTGYEPIIKAAMSVDTNKLLKLHELFPSSAMRTSLAEHVNQSVQISSPEHLVFKPHDLAAAIQFKSEHADTVTVAGGTDICVYWNKRGVEPKHLMTIGHLAELHELRMDDDTIIVGATTTLTELEDYLRNRVPEFHHMLWLFGSPQIRNAGTLAGNIANASPIADSLPFLHVMDAKLELRGSKGTRLVDINNFYKGYKKLDLSSDELITRVHIALPKEGEILRLYKVSRRKHLDISAFTAAFRLTIDAGAVKHIAIAYGGVAPTIVRLRKTEAFLTGQPFDLERLTKARELALSEISPISDVRGSSEFRNTLAANVLMKLFHETKAAKVNA